MYKVLSRLADVAGLVALSWPFVGKWVPERYQFIGTILAVVLVVAILNLGVRLVRSLRSPLAEDSRVRSGSGDYSSIAFAHFREQVLQRASH
jgi:hypothetical protein